MIDKGRIKLVTIIVLIATSLLMLVSIDNDNHKNVIVKSCK